jgi:hypothetical protein
MGPKSAAKLWIGCVALGCLGGCEREKTPLEKMGLDEEQARKILREIEHTATHSPPPSSPPAGQPRATAQRPATTTELAPPPLEAQDFDPDLHTDRFIVDGLVDVTEAAQSSAHRSGVYVVTREQQLLLAPLGPLSKASGPAASPVAELPSDSGEFAVAPGPSFTRKHAYWITNRKLHQGTLGSKDPAPAVAHDARVATRVSALSVDLEGTREPRDLVAYIALPREPDGPLIARLWSSNGQTLTLTDPGSAALSVQIVRQGERIVAYALEGRTSMSILHAREIATTDDEMRLLEDEVVWVGGAATPTTELRVASDDANDVFGLLPIERDSLNFGLALLELSLAEGDDPAPNQWAPFANGMDYSPTGADVVCGMLTLVFARPSDPSPHAPQQLVLAEMTEGRLSSELVLSRSKVFFDTSIAAVEGGALVSYVADRRTWARAVRCKGR